MKRYAIGAVVGGVVLFLLGYLIYVVILHDPEFARGSASTLAAKAALNLPAIFLAEVLFGFLITRGLIKSGAVSSVAGSAKVGAMIGLVAGLAFALLLFGTTELTTAAGVVYEGVTWAIRWGVAAAVVAMVVGKMKD